MRVLAVDQGTTSTRAVLVDDRGRAEVVAAIPHRQIYPHPGWVEHDPDELLANVASAVALAGDARAVGIDNQGESCLAWNRRSGRPVSPVIVWQDERTADDCARLRASGAEALTLARTGLPLDPYFSASKLGWLLREIPEARRLAASGELCLGTTDAFFRHRLTGRFETDVATASRTSLMDLATCAWDDELCALFGVPVEALPRITPTSGELGEIGDRGLPLSASIVDQQAALRGHGCADRGAAKITFGTGAFVLAVAGPDLPPAQGGPLPTVAWTGAGGRPVYALDGGVHAAAAALNWARGLGLFADWDEIADFDRPPAISRGLAFVPALAGLACPHWDRAAKGAWMGMTLDAGPRDLVQAVLEGVAFRTAEVVAAMDAVLPIAAPVSIDGGMTRNRWFCQFLADALGREVRVSDEPELTALGTATLAAEGIGAVIAPPPGGARLSPRDVPPSWAETFTEARTAVQAFGARARP
jgi:glycerol kinase